LHDPDIAQRIDVERLNTAVDKITSIIMQVEDTNTEYVGIINTFIEHIEEEYDMDYPKEEEKEILRVNRERQYLPIGLKNTSIHILSF
jgi:hypothetical protein